MRALKNVKQRVRTISYIKVVRFRSHIYVCVCVFDTSSRLHFRSWTLDSCVINVATFVLPWNLTIQ